MGVCTHAEAYAACPETELVAVCDENRQQCDTCGNRWNVRGRYNDFDRMLEEVRPDIISVCTPDSTHADFVRRAIAADRTRAVLAEKPLATHLEDARQLEELARRKGVVLAVNYTRRYADPIWRFRDIIQSAGIGTPILVTGFYTKGTLHNGTHWFDLARIFLGEPVKVCGRDRLREHGDDPTLDVDLEFACGARGRLYGCCADDFTIFEMDLLGARGRLRLLDSSNLIEWFECTEGVPYAGYRSLHLRNKEENGLRDALLHLVEDVVECIPERRTPRCSASDGIRALEIAMAARESASMASSATPERQ